MELQLNLGSASSSRARDRDAPKHILLLGAFGGQSIDSLPDSKLRLLERPIVPIDADDIDAAIGRLNPGFRLDPDDPATTVPLRDLDDFHPDALCERDPQLLNITRLRKGLADPAKSDDAIAAAQDLIAGLSTGTGSAAEPLSKRAEAVPDRPETTTDTMARLLGASRTSDTGHQRGASKVVERLIADAAGSSSIIDNDTARQVGIDLEACATQILRKLLGSESFQTLESAWRSLRWFAERLDADTECELSLFSAALDQLRSITGDDSGAADELKTHIARQWQQRLIDDPPSLIVALYPISSDPESLRVLSWLMDLAGRLGTPLLAAADASLVGLDQSADRSRLVDGSDLARVSLQEWTALRNHPAAAYTAAGFPQFLLRQPYGHKSDPIDSFGFEELSPRPDRGEFLWAPAAIGLAAVWIQAQAGQPPRLDDMPLVVYDDGGGQAIMPPTEFYLSDSAASVLSGKGFTALRASRNSTSVHVRQIEPIAVATAT